MDHDGWNNGREKRTGTNPKSNVVYASTIILLLTALIMCAIHKEKIDSFFGYDTQDTTTYDTTYIESSNQTRPGSAFGSSREPNNPGSLHNPVSSSTPASESPFNAEPSAEPMALFTPDPMPEPTSTSTPESTSRPATPEPNPSSEPTLDPVPSLDIFSCLGIYEDDNGNSIELRLSTQFHVMSYAMRLHYNHGTAGLRGRNGHSSTDDSSYILFTVDYDGDAYPFTFQLGDGYIFVDSSNCFGPFDGHEFAGTYYMTQQF